MMRTLIKLLISILFAKGSYQLTCYDCDYLEAISSGTQTDQFLAAMKRPQTNAKCKLDKDDFLKSPTTPISCGPAAAGFVARCERTTAYTKVTYNGEEVEVNMWGKFCSTIKEDTYLPAVNNGCDKERIESEGRNNIKQLPGVTDATVTGEDCFCNTANCNGASQIDTNTAANSLLTAMVFALFL